MRWCSSYTAIFLFGSLLFKSKKTKIWENRSGNIQRASSHSVGKRNVRVLQCDHRCVSDTHFSFFGYKILLPVLALFYRDSSVALCTRLILAHRRHVLTSSGLDSDEEDGCLFLLTSIYAYLTAHEGIIPFARRRLCHMWVGFHKLPLFDIVRGVLCASMCIMVPFYCQCVHRG